MGDTSIIMCIRVDGECACASGMVAWVFLVTARSELDSDIMELSVTTTVRGEGAHTPVSQLLASLTSDLRSP